MIKTTLRNHGSGASHQGMLRCTHLPFKVANVHHHPVTPQRSCQLNNLTPYCEISVDEQPDKEEQTRLMMCMQYYLKMTE